MGLFDDIGNLFEDVVGTVSDAVTDYQKQRRKTKALRYEKQLGKQVIKAGAKTYSGIVTGDSAYSTFAEGAAGTALIVGEAGEIVGDITLASMASDAADAVKSGLASAGTTLDKALGGASVQTPFGEASSGALVAVAGIGLALVVLTRK